MTGPAPATGDRDHHCRYRAVRQLVAAACPVCGKEVAAGRHGCGECLRWMLSDFASHMFLYHRDQLDAWAAEIGAEIHRRDR